MRFLCCAVLAFSAMAISCGSGANPCAGISCSGHGICSVAGDSATCRCEPGYREHDLECLVDANPCPGILCSGHGVCVVGGNSVVCRCDPGYREHNLECLVDANPCAGVLCSGHGVCLVAGNSAVCRCEAGYREQNLECLVEANPCAGVLCSGKGVCSVTGNTAACTCDSGYRASGLTCVPVIAGITAGSCTMAETVAGSSRVVCLDMTGSEYTPANAEAACQTSSGSSMPFSSGHCSTQQCIGACRIGEGTTSEQVYYYYDDRPDASALKTDCTASGGTWFVP